MYCEKLHILFAVKLAQKEQLGLNVYRCRLLSQYLFRQDPDSSPSAIETFTSRAFIPLAQGG